jgi:hypothetical protein
MLALIRRLWRDPLTAPPVKRGFFWMVKPWHAAAGLYLFTIPFVLLLEEFSCPRAVVCGLGLGYAALAFIIVVFPVAQAAVLWPGERERGTIEPLLMTPASRLRLVWLRFLGIVGPWLLLFAGMIPAYAILSGSDFFDKPLIAIFCNRAGLGVFVLLERSEPIHWSFAKLGVATSRMVNDLSLFLFAVALSYWVSARCRTTRAALSLTFALIAVPYMVLFHNGAQHLLVRHVVDWFTPGSPGWTSGRDWDHSYEAYAAKVRTVTTALAVGLMLLRFLLTWLMVRSVARNFDRWMLRDKTAPR